jgi:hypothetical protein
MSKGNMDNDYFYAEMLNMMRLQGGKDNPVTLQLGIMQSANSVKIDDLILDAEDLYIADYLVADYSRQLKTPYISNVEVSHSEDTEHDVSLTEQDGIIYTDGLKKGDLVVVQKLNNNDMYVILARVVQV